MALVTLSRFAVRSCGRLTLPMNQRSADGVVAVAGRRRELSGRLVQGECEQIGPGVLRPIDARLPGCHLRLVAGAERGENLESRVSSVNLERHIRMCG